jgi:hypothetical protein
MTLPARHSGVLRRHRLSARPARAVRNELLLHDIEADGMLLELPGSLGAVGLGT